jgi:hypothetical protein
VWLEFFDLSDRSRLSGVTFFHVFSVSATIFFYPGDRPLCISGQNEDRCASSAGSFRKKLFVTKEVLPVPCTEVSFSNGTGPEKGTGRAPFSASVATATPGMCTTDDVVVPW